MPVAMAANANLFVSAENSQFGNLISGPQVVEVVVIDSNIDQLDEDLGEPDVTVNSKKLRMAQAKDGNWYGYFADVQMAQLADYVSISAGNGKGIDFGTFCSPSTALTASGVNFAETKGVAFPNNFGVNGTSTWNVTQIAGSCTAFTGTSAGDANGTNNVVREYKDLNTNSAVTVGQLGIDSGDNTNDAVWPFVQLYDFSAGSTVTVAYNKGGGAQTATLTFDTADGNAVTTTDREFYPKGAQVFIEIADSWLNIDPTDEDSWTFDTSTSPTILYDRYDENGANSSTSSPNISSNLINLMQADALLKINQSTSGEDILTFQDNNIGPSSPGNTVTILETGVNTGVFVNYDSEDTSNIIITSTASRGKAATIDYDDSDKSIVVQSSFGTIDISIDDDEWNSGETASVTLIDQDLNKNSRSDEDLAVESSSTRLIPSLVTGDPFTLGESLTNSEYAVTVQNIVTTSTYPLIAPTTGTLGTLQWTDNSGSKVKTSELTVARYSNIGYLEAGTSHTDVRMIFVPANGTIADLTSSINTNSSGKFFGTNLFAWNVQSLNSTLTSYSFYLVNGTTTFTNATGTSIVELTTSQAATGSVALSTANLGKIGTIEDGDDQVSILISLPAGTDLTSGTTYPVTLDFMTFGFTNDGDDAAERTSNQIIRLELEESGDNTGVFEGSLEYVMINQLNVQTASTYTGLTLEGDAPTFIAFEDLTDEDSPRVNYLDLGQDGVETQIASISCSKSLWYS